MLRRPLALAAVLVLLLPASALARRGSDEVRVSGTCGRGAAVELRAREHHGAIEVELRVRRGRNRERWSVVLVHERRVAVRTTVRTRSGSGLRVRRDLPNYAGADQITARASGPRGLTCSATAVVPGS